jgi:hypothetical protein
VPKIAEPKEKLRHFTARPSVSGTRDAPLKYKIELHFTGLRKIRQDLQERKEGME